MRPIFPLSHFFVKYSNLDHAFTRIIKIMSFLKSIWSDSLVVSSQFEKRSPKPGSNLWKGDFFMMSNVCILLKSKLFKYFMPPSDYLYIFSFGYSVLIPLVLLIISLPAATFVVC